VSIARLRAGRFAGGCFAEDLFAADVFGVDFFTGIGGDSVTGAGRRRPWLL
jgi:hypothetical protein